ncbi:MULTISPECIES: peptidase inhibitor family I36 protein [Streptomyces]|uniref:Peptidase inhibitor family I36 protein n=1 Tax=Streptomyces flavovirens TaxID=52258 RepID=A0ABV8NB03_9ACTN|nr:peptidase inhibitor family I36 protein [Streptomyces sp. MBT51]MBK3597027.1 peptidase inhibitor family I36 protein [Streptomyces sp. MBT51]
MNLRKSLAFAGVTILTAATASQAHAAEPSELQQQIDTVLANTTGGVQISLNEIAWEGGQAIMSFPLPGEEVAPPSSQAAIDLQTQQAGVSKQSVKAAAAAGEALAAASDSCPTEVFGNDWYCFYQYKDFGGRRLQWNQAKHDVVFFSQFDFVNKTSSWSNKGGKYIYVQGRSQTGSDRSCWEKPLILWQEAPHTSKAFVGSSLDNKADCFWTSY